MATTEILQFAGGVGANVLTQAQYAALTSLIANGFTTGTAQSPQLNKVWRQSSFMAAGLANMMVNRGISVPDDGNLTNLVAEIESALDAYLDKSVAGNSDVTLSATTEANYPIIDLVGAITGNINVIVPAAPGRWIFLNSTTGAFTITIKTPGGSGVVIAQGVATSVFSDGVNVYPSTSTGTTPAQFDNTTKLATTAFVKQAGGAFAGLSSYSANQTLPLSDVGKMVLFTGSTASQTITLPAANTVPAGYGYYIVNQASVLVTGAASGADNIAINNAGAIVSTAATIQLSQGDCIIFVSNGVSLWDTFGITLSKSRSVRAWVTLDGTSGGTIAASYNVSSFTRNATGDYTINFPTGTFSDANYAVAGIQTSAQGGANLAIKAASPASAPTLKTTTQCELIVGNGTSLTDVKQLTAIFIGN